MLLATRGPSSSRHPSSCLLLTGADENPASHAQDGPAAPMTVVPQVVDG